MDSEQFSRYAMNSVYLVPLRLLRPTGAERRSACITLSDMRGMGFESGSWYAGWAVGELGPCCSLVAARLRRATHGTGMRHDGGAAAYS